jgi:hypothetical protein
MSPYVRTVEPFEIRCAKMVGTMSGETSRRVYLTRLTEAENPVMNHFAERVV